MNTKNKNKDEVNKLEIGIRKFIANRNYFEINSIKISVTEDNHCYENAIAERVNGILKDEFYLD